MQAYWHKPPNSQSCSRKAPQHASFGASSEQHSDPPIQCLPLGQETRGRYLAQKGATYPTVGRDERRRRAGALAPPECGEADGEQDQRTLDRDCGLGGRSASGEVVDGDGGGEGGEGREAGEGEGGEEGGGWFHFGGLRALVGVGGEMGGWLVDMFVGLAVLHMYVGLDGRVFGRADCVLCARKR